jgi:hypothetical protein
MGGVVAAIPDLRAVGSAPLRPRLRHHTHRRSAASAVSRPRNAHARIDGRYACLCSAADRSVQRLRRRRRWTAPAACWAARPRSCPLSARQRARTNSCGALPHLAAPQGATTYSCLWPAPVSASPCPGTVDGAWELAPWLLPCLPSHRGFQLYYGRHRRPLWRFSPIRLVAPAADWPLDTSWGCSAHVALAPLTRPPAPDTPTPGRASIHGAAVGVCGPACRWTSVAGTARAARARSRLAGLAWAGAYPGGSAPPDPCQPKRIVVRVVFYWGLCAAAGGPR